MTTRKSQSLRGKFVRTVLLVTAIIGLSTIGIVMMTSQRSSEEHLRAVQHYIEEGIERKGLVLTENQALALRGLTLDNAFWSMQSLVQDAVSKDDDVVYGLYINSSGKTMAYSRAGLPKEEQEVPNGSRWRELNIGEAELLVRQPAVSRANRLGQDVVEIAVPVVDDEQEMLGTIRYGLSTHRMQRALETAEAESEARVMRSIWIVGSVAGFAMLIGLLLSRVQAIRITNPLGELTQASRKLAAGDRTVRVKIESRDELEELGSSFNHMVEDLDSSYRQLEEMNRTLEQRVVARTTDLANKNRDMRLVLDNVDQGLLMAHCDGTLTLERSRVVEEWFGAYEDGASAWSFLAHISPEFSTTLELGWEQLMANVLPFELCLEQLPTRLSANERTWQLRYLPFRNQGELEGILIVINEVTMQLAREREQAEQTELLNGFQRLLVDRAGFLRFVQEASSLIERIRSTDIEETPLRRALHTLKGNAALMKLTVIADLAHRLEDELVETGRLDARLLHELTTRWDTLLHLLDKLGANRDKELLEVPNAEHSRLMARLSTEADVPPELLQELQSWAHEPLSLSLERLGAEAKALSKRLGKGDINVRVEAQPKDARLDPKRWTRFFSELVHLVRNAVDHGIEPPNERSEARKPSPGQLVLAAHLTSGSIVFEISDDGRGVDWAAVRRQAKSLQLAHATPADLQRALFEDGFTTRAECSATSGRGVGLAAFKRLVDQMQGSIEVFSEPGKGARWRISLPYPLPKDERRAA